MSNDMRTTPAVFRGVIHGRTIDLETAPGLPDGQSVSVTLEPVQQRLPPGDGVRHSAGGWAEDADEVDRYLEWNRRQRKTGRQGLSE
jgi:hypothetical protein